MSSLWLGLRCCAAILAGLAVVCGATILFVSPNTAAIVVGTYALILVAGTEWGGRAESKSFAIPSENVETIDVLRKAPIPRPVRLKEVAKSNRFRLAMMAGSFLAFDFLLAALYVKVSIPLRPSNKLLVYAVVGLGTIGFVAMCSRLRSRFAKLRNLTSTGKLAIGKVSSLRVRRGGMHFVSYQFNDLSGQAICASGIDTSKMLTAGMRVTVFFDPEDPAKDQVPDCGSPYEVVFSSGINV